MHFNRLFGIVLLIAAAALMSFGYTASQGVGEQIHETFTGRFTDSTTWYILLGFAAAIGGVVMLASRDQA